MVWKEDLDEDEKDDGCSWGVNTYCYLIVCSKWMSSMEAVTHGDIACLSANNKELQHTLHILSGSSATNVAVVKSLQDKCNFTRETSCDVNPFQKLSHTKLLSMVTVARHYDLTHFYLCWTDIQLFFFLIVFFFHDFLVIFENCWFSGGHWC